MLAAAPVQLIGILVESIHHLCPPTSLQILGFTRLVNEKSFHSFFECFPSGINAQYGICVASKMKYGAKSVLVKKEHFNNDWKMSAAGNHHQLNYEDDLHWEPFWLSLIKDSARALKSLMVFLVEQPSQLKYIEWPGFKSTLKTATLTLILVALLIIALSSVDAVLCYLLAVMLRRTP